MKVRRNIAAIPHRTADETWQAICDLVIGTGTVDGSQLRAATGILTSLITDELFATHPLTLSGVGPRLVLYTVHGLDAVEAGHAIDPINWVPTAGDWNFYVPCDEVNYAWVEKSLAECAPKFVVHALGADLDKVADIDQQQEANAPLAINWGGL